MLLEQVGILLAYVLANIMAASHSIRHHPQNIQTLLRVVEAVNFPDAHVLFRSNRDRPMRWHWNDE